MSSRNSLICSIIFSRSVLASAARIFAYYRDRITSISPDFDSFGTLAGLAHRRALFVCVRAANCNLHSDSDSSLLKRHVSESRRGGSGNEIGWIPIYSSQERCRRRNISHDGERTRPIVLKYDKAVFLRNRFSSITRRSSNAGAVFPRRERITLSTTARN